MPRRNVQRQADLVRIRSQLPTVFTPSAPVAQRELFAGRWRQITQVLDAVFQDGKHAVLYGERGVGKTSLASLIYDFWNEHHKDADLVAPRVNCDTTDTFGTVWSKVADEIELLYLKRGLDLSSGLGDASEQLAELKSGAATPHLIRRFIELSGKSFVIVVDEFDRLQNKSDQRLFSDTIKTLSDHLTDATLVIVGVADTVEGLIEEHASVDRNLVQILMPTMTIDELSEIVENGAKRLGLKFAKDATMCIAQLSQGLPPYAHLFSLHASIYAVEKNRTDVTKGDVDIALHVASSMAQETVRKAYHTATTSQRTDSIYKEVLLACAISPVDDLSYFAPADVCKPLSAIMKKQRNIASFTRQLESLCTEDRGNVLDRIGAKRKARYRFADPLMKPYVVIRGLDDGLLDLRQVLPKQNTQGATRPGGSRRNRARN